MIDPLLAAFPGLSPGNYRITSPASYQYNCIAWAASKNDRWWWPHPDAFWPFGAPFAEMIDAFQAAYATLGYELCETPEFELRFEKIAIFADSTGTPTHAARQLDTGRWTSKLGRSEDIEHVTADAVNCADYGTPVVFMRRSRPRWRRLSAVFRRTWSSVFGSVFRGPP